MICTLLIIAFMFIGLGISLGMHGKPRPEYNFWVQLFSTVISFLLYWGAGLFDKFFE
jgi:hypothetical protein